MKKIVLECMQETARQHREIHQFNLKHAKRRSMLEWVMGWVALVLFVTIAGAAIYILFNPAKFPDRIVSFTVPALIADILGIMKCLRIFRAS